MVVPVLLEGLAFDIVSNSSSDKDLDMGGADPGLDCTERIRFNRERVGICPVRVQQ